MSTAASAAPQPKPTFPFRVQVWGNLMTGQLPLDLRAKKPSCVKFFYPGGEDGMETEEIKLEPVDLVERKKRLQELLMNGRIRKTVILGDDFEILLETRSVQEAMDASLLPEGWEPPKGMTEEWMETFKSARVLASSIITYGGSDIGDTPEKRYQFVMKLPEPVFSLLVDEWNMLMREQRDLATPRVLGVVLPKS